MRALEGMNDVRSATVSFLFTDIEGSTRLLKHLRERYGDSLDDHQRILREAFAANGGREIDTQGDAFFVAFDRARDAILAAADSQRALAEHDWPEGAEFRVRIGIHTGEAAVAGERYVGLAVNRAARISAAGHGGQVLVSQTTLNLIEDEETELPGLRLRDLGEQRLKDLDRPVRLYQLEGPGLADSFPPLRTAETPFAGREDDLAAAAEATIGRRLLRPRRRKLLVAALVVAAAAAAVGTIAATRGPSHPLVAANRVGVLDLHSGKVIGNIAVGPQAGITPGVGANGRTVAVGGGSVWVANDNQTLSRIDPRTLKPTTIGLDGGVVDVAVASPDLFAALGASGLESVAQSGTPSSVTLPNSIGPGAAVTAVAAGKRVLWVAADNLNDLSVLAFDPTSDHVRWQKHIGTAGACSLAVGAGYVWVTDAADNTLVRLDPRTRHIETVQIPFAGSVAVGDGKVWVTDETDNQVWWDDVRLGHAPGVTQVGPKPVRIAYGAGSVWVANSGDGTISRLNAASPSNAPKTTKVAAHVGSLAVGDARLWVVVPPAP